MTQYLLSVYQPDGAAPGPEILDKIVADLDVLNRELKDAGAWVFTAGLYPVESSTVVRDRDGDALITDGPYIEGKEHLGGFTIVEAADLDAALVWAGKMAGATTLPIEVRPIQYSQA
jgi:hypothetical protein